LFKALTVFVEEKEISPIVAAHSEKANILTKVAECTEDEPYHYAFKSVV